MKTTINKKHYLARRLLLTACMLCCTAMLLLNPTVAYATETDGGNKIMQSELFQSGQQFLTDATAVAAILCPIIAGLLCIYYAIRMAGAEEQQDKIVWKKNIKLALIVGASAGIFSGLVSLILSYT